MERCADVSEGECIFLCKETPSSDGSNGSEGINKLVVMDDNLVWTATASSTIKRWRVPGRRTGRIGDFASSGFEADHESPTMTPIHGRPSVSPFGGFSQDTQPSAILTRRHDSFTNQDARYRSESPVSLSDPPSRRAESPSLFTVRSPKRSSHFPYAVAIPGPFSSDASLHSPIPQWASSPPGTGVDSTLYGIPFQSLSKLAPPFRLLSSRNLHSGILNPRHHLRGQVPYSLSSAHPVYDLQFFSELAHSHGFTSTQCR